MWIIGDHATGGVAGYSLKNTRKKAAINKKKLINKTALTAII